MRTRGRASEVYPCSVIGVENQVIPPVNERERF